MIAEENAEFAQAQRADRELQQQRQQQRDEQLAAERPVRERLQDDNPAVEQQQFEATERTRLVAEQARLAASLPPEPSAGEGVEVAFNFHRADGQPARFIRRFRLDSSVEHLHTAVLANSLAPNNMEICGGYPPRSVPQHGTIEEVFGRERQLSVRVRRNLPGV